ncbi:YraN family protein [Clostridioides difficile]
MNNKEKGDFGEEIAVNYLLSKGAKILEKNYRLRIGEVDIIANIGDEVVFVEVKSRSNIKYGYPCESVDFKKEKR